MKPMSDRMEAVLAVVKDAREGQISGWSVAKWLNQGRHPDGVRESLRALTNRGLIVMKPMEVDPDEFRKAFPDRLLALYSPAKTEEA